MLIDRTQRGWAIASLGIFAAALAVYMFYAWSAPEGPRGGSAIGLFFGVVGFGFMTFAAALGARKRVPTWRGGGGPSRRGGDFWVGLGELPAVLFLSGCFFFRAGRPGVIA